MEVGVHYRHGISTQDGYYVGQRGAEKLVIRPNGVIAGKANLPYEIVKVTVPSGATTATTNKSKARVGGSIIGFVPNATTAPAVASIVLGSGGEITLTTAATADVAREFAVTVLLK